MTDHPTDTPDATPDWVERAIPAVSEVPQNPTRVTKRKFAHELYPHADEAEVRELAIEVPYLYAQALAFDVWGTGWFDAFPGGHEKGTPEHTTAAQMTTSRTLLLIEHRRTALLADALLQGLSGQEAWSWAESRMDETGEWVYERAVHYGIDPYAIKPYPCGPVPDHHDHLDPPDTHGGRIVHRIPGAEADCVDCTEVPESTDRLDV